MKNLKKVLALAVAFVMCFTMFAGAAVYSDVPAGSDYSEAVTLLSDLGVIAGLPDGSFGVNQTITRADAACLIARMLTGETMPSKYAGASNFTDVRKDAYYESAVAYCAIMGITSGTSTTLGTYSPEREITDGEFIAMITRALGYDTPSNPLSFPMGNVARAQQEGILDNVNVVVDSPALRGEDAQMIYNALFADYDAYSKQQNIYMGADDQVEYTIAHEVFSLDRLAVDTNNDVLYKDDIETTKGDRCVAHTWVVVGVDPRDDVNTYTAFPIKDKTDDILGIDLRGEKDQAVTFVYDGDAESILGYQVELWGDDDHTGTEHDIVAVKTVKGQTAYDWNISMGEDGADELTVADGKTVDAEDATLGLPNTIDKDEKDLLAGVHIDPANDVDAYVAVPFEDKDDAWKNKDGDSYRLFDWDSDGDIEFALKTTRKYAEVTDIDSQDISFKCILDGKEITVDREIGGDQLKFDCGSIEEDDVIEMTYSRAYSAKEKGEVVSVAVEKVSSDIKQLTKVSTKGDLQMTFDGDVYEYASDDYAWDLVDYGKYSKLTEFELEGNYELWLDANGYVVKIEESDNNSGYLVVLELDDGTNNMSKSRSTRASMKVKLDDNTVDVYDVAYDLQITGTIADIKGASSDNDKKRDVQTIVWDDEIDASSVQTRKNINTHKALTGSNKYAFYNKDNYSWVSDNRMVGQVYKYWMDSDKVITKLERVAETVDYYEQYYDDTGVVRVSGGSVEDPNNAGKAKTDTRTYLGRTFNGNIYLKQADVLFIADYGFVSEETYSHHGTPTARVAADPDKVLAIPATAANLRKIGATGMTGSNLADISNTANNESNTTYSIAPTTLSDWYGGKIALYNGKAVVGHADKNNRSTNTDSRVTTRSAQIAYDIDKDNYATAAIMTVNNFNDFDKSVSVALITDVDAVNRKDTVFTIEGAVAGKVGAFTTVEAEDGASEIFFYNDNGTITAYDDLSAVRDDIDDKAVYAEITQDADGKITKVVVMDYQKDYYGALVGEKRMVVRLLLGNKDEIDNVSVAYGSQARDLSGTKSGENIVVYAAPDKFYEMPNISWHNSFDLTGSTVYYQITNESIAMQKGQKLQAQYGSGRTPNAGFTKEPKIEEASDYTAIVASRTRETSNADKYAVADVAFDKQQLVGVGTGASRLDLLNGEDAQAVFSYTKRFSQTDVEEILPTVSIEKATDGISLNNGQAQKTWLGFNTLGNTLAADQEIYIEVDGVGRKTIQLNANDSQETIRKKVKDALFVDFLDSDEWTAKVDNTNGVVEVEAVDPAAHKKFTINGYGVGDGAVDITTNIKASVTDKTVGAAEATKSSAAELVLEFTGVANNTGSNKKTTMSFTIKVSDQTNGTDIPWTINVPLSENGSAKDVADWAVTPLKNALKNHITGAEEWKVKANDDGTVTITQTADVDGNATTWGDISRPSYS